MALFTQPAKFGEGKLPGSILRYLLTTFLIVAGLSPNFLYAEKKYVDTIKILKSIIPSANSYRNIVIPDPITDGGPNKILKKILDSDQKLLAYSREIHTNTGCSSSCLPLHFLIVLSPKLKFLAILEVEKLTKKNHVPFNTNDYIKINSILSAPPASYKNLNEPLDLVDALTRETKKELAGDIVTLAAFTSFRAYQYLEHTKFILEKLNRK